VEIWLKPHKIDFLTMGGIAPLDPGKGAYPIKLIFFLKNVRACLYIWVYG
jgi:hypothetical protein